MSKTPRVDKLLAKYQDDSFARTELAEYRSLARELEWELTDNQAMLDVWSQHTAKFAERITVLEGRLDEAKQTEPPTILMAVADVASRHYYKGPQDRRQAPGPRRLAKLYGCDKNRRGKAERQPKDEYETTWMHIAGKSNGTGRRKGDYEAWLRTPIKFAPEDGVLDRMEAFLRGGLGSSIPCSASNPRGRGQEQRKAERRQKQRRDVKSPAALNADGVPFCRRVSTSELYPERRKADRRKS
jgi:hypothetical protein